MKHLPALFSLAALVVLSACNGTFLSSQGPTETGSTAVDQEVSNQEAMEDASSSSSVAVSSDEETINAFYAAIEAQELETAYNMYANPKVSLATFRGWYKDVTRVAVTDIKKGEDGVFTFNVALEEDTGVASNFAVRMRVEDGTVDTLSSDGLDATYTNEELGIVFDYPAEWPTPTVNMINSEEMPDNMGAWYKKIRWSIDFGPVCNECAEGTDVRFFSLDGLDPSYASEHEAAIRDDDMMDIKREFFVSGHDAIEYTSGGMCGYLSALIQGEKNAYVLSGFCLADSDQRTAEFREILKGITLP